MIRFTLYEEVAITQIKEIVVAIAAPSIPHLGIKIILKTTFITAPERIIQALVLGCPTAANE